MKYHIYDELSFSKEKGQTMITLFERAENKFHTLCDSIFMMSGKDKTLGTEMNQWHPGAWGSREGTDCNYKGTQVLG